jgi:hypothetical protein
LEIMASDSSSQSFDAAKKGVEMAKRWPRIWYRREANRVGGAMVLLGKTTCVGLLAGEVRSLTMLTG